jgi:hypothetical protein
MARRVAVAFYKLVEITKIALKDACYVIIFFVVYTWLDAVNVATDDLKEAVVDDEGSTTTETPRGWRRIPLSHTQRAVNVREFLLFVLLARLPGKRIEFEG